MIEASERAVIAVILHKPDLTPNVLARVPVEQFTGSNRLVVEAILGMRVARKAIDPGTVTTEMSRRGTLARVGADYVHRIAAEFISADTLPYHLDILADAWRLRRLFQIGQRIADATQASDADSTTIAQTAAEHIQGILDWAEADRDDLTTLTLKEFLSGEDEPYDWVIPGLLERGDRFVLTGSEGLGKSVLFRQIAVAAAAGIHPFTLARIPPQRVLYVDVENPRAKLRRALKSLRLAAKQAGGDPDENLWIECHPPGLDLTQPADEAWLVSRVTALQPSILVTGPLYRLHAKNPNDEEPARQVAKVLDRCRSAANCALVLEAHAGHALESNGKRTIRPTGTSLWLRWPEFGHGIRATEDFRPDNRVVEFVSWRGDRDERDWPKRLRQGGSWPWVPATDPNSEWTPHKVLGGAS